MKHPNIRTLLLGLLVALGIPACGGGSGGSTTTAGIGGTGVTSTGTVTGFGSVFVNGVEYQSGSAAVTIDGVIGNDTDLKLGMVVTVKGSIDSSGTQGTATSIAFSSELHGPVSSITLDPNNTQRKTLAIIGRQVIVDAVSTTFDNYSFSSITKNDVVEVSGFTDASGNILATRIERTGTHQSGSPITVTLKGNITFLSQTSFKLQNNTTTINFDNNTDMSGLTSSTSFANGSLIKVTGIYDDAAGIITATKIEAEDKGIPQDDGAQVELQGVVSQFNGLNDFLVDGQQVNASQAALKPISLSLADGMTVEVEGTINNGTLIASEVKGREGNIEVRAFVSADVLNQTLQLKVTQQGNSIAILVDNNQTQMEDETTAQVPPQNLLANISTTDHLEIEAYQDNGNLIATHVKRIDPNTDTAIKLQGPLDSFDRMNQTVTILGNTFKTDQATQYSANEQSTDASTFFNTLLAQGKIVQIKDNADPAFTTLGNGFAEEMTLE